jgi:hypothetical protein
VVFERGETILGCSLSAQEPQLSAGKELMAKREGGGALE